MICLAENVLTSLSSLSNDFKVTNGLQNILKVTYCQTLCIWLASGSFDELRKAHASLYISVKFCKKLILLVTIFFNVKDSLYQGTMKYHY